MKAQYIRWLRATVEFWESPRLKLSEELGVLEDELNAYFACSGLSEREERKLKKTWRESADLKPLEDYYD